MSTIARTRAMASGILLYLVMAFATAQGISDFEYIARYLPFESGVWVDANGDGVGDALGYDVNQDGNWDAYRLSTFSDGYLNVVILDKSGRGSFIPAQFFFDLTGDGRFNALFYVSDPTQASPQAWIALDPEGDGTFTDWVTLSAAQTPTTIPVDVGGGTFTRDTFTTNNHAVTSALLAINHSLSTGITGRWLEPDCNTSLNGCR
jgi:hypothetical protein